MDSIQLSLRRVTTDALTDQHLRLDPLLNHATKNDRPLEAIDKKRAIE
jgi:hypothetical protein